eukprot:scaffold162436_cov35-Tisochrysis_lutea.AAC.1
MGARGAVPRGMPLIKAEVVCALAKVLSLGAPVLNQYSSKTKNTLNVIGDGDGGGTEKPCCGKNVHLYQCDIGRFVMAASLLEIEVE